MPAERRPCHGRRVEADFATRDRVLLCVPSAQAMPAWIEVEDEFAREGLGMVRSRGEPNEEAVTSAEQGGARLARPTRRCADGLVRGRPGRFVFEGEAAEGGPASVFVVSRNVSP